MSQPPPEGPSGPKTQELARLAERYEAPGINSLFEGQALPVWKEAFGSTIVDVDGRRYVDLTSGFGVATIGHRHPRVLAAIARQSQTLLHGLGDAASHPQRIQLAARLAAVAPFEDAQVYFAISGSDAVEVALKTAQLATGRAGILAFEPAYHGVTLGALATTSRPAFAHPFVGRLREPVARLTFGATGRQIAEALDAHPGTGCCIVEPVVGREGVLLPPPGWLRELAEICRHYRVLLIADEVFTGFGRTGRLWACEHDACVPDLLCCGKALGGGLPIAAVLARRPTFSVWQHPGEARHTATFVAHPLACAAALTTLDVLQQERLIERARKLEGTVRQALLPLERGCAVRGRGLLWGIETPHASQAKDWARAALRRGCFVLAGGASGRVLQIAPPLSIAQDELEGALAVLRETAPCVTG